MAAAPGATGTGQGMGVYALMAVGVGAMLGAWCRWGLGSWLNPLFPTLPLGTLAANLGGAFFIGLAVEFSARHASVPPELRLLVITGFLGALTTFSTFSAEVVTLLRRSELVWAVASMGAHLMGSLLLTAAGMWVARMVVR